LDLILLANPEQMDRTLLLKWAGLFPAHFIEPML